VTLLMTVCSGKPDRLAGNAAYPLNNLSVGGLLRLGPLERRNPQTAPPGTLKVVWLHINISGRLTGAMLCFAHTDKTRASKLYICRRERLFPQGRNALGRVTSDKWFRGGPWDLLTKWDASSRSNDILAAITLTTPVRCQKPARANRPDDPQTALTGNFQLPSIQPWLPAATCIHPACTGTSHFQNRVAWADKSGRESLCRLIPR